MPGAEGPKYLNSPATRLFDKSRTLYGIDLAKAAIRKAGLTVIVEGYTDVMAAHQAGFANVVASLGTALTHGQVELATRYADAVALAYDVDLAGEAATQRGLLEELGPDQAVSKVRVVRIPAGKDPDELIRTDPEAWRTAVAEAPPVLDYFMDRAVASVDLSSVTGRREVTAPGAGRAAPRGGSARADALPPAPVAPRRRRREGPADELAATPRPALRQPVERGWRPARARERHPPAPRGGGAARPAALPGHRRRSRRRPAAVPRGRRRRPCSRLGVARPARSNDAAAIETFVGGLDAATAELARDLLADVRADTSPRLEPDAARDALRSCLRRLRVQRIEDAIRDGRLLMDEADREGDAARVRTLEEQMTHLGREKAELTRAMREPATAGARRS